MNTKQQNHDTSAMRVDMKLEVEIIPSPTSSDPSGSTNA